MAKNKDRRQQQQDLRKGDQNERQQTGNRGGQQSQEGRMGNLNEERGNQEAIQTGKRGSQGGNR